MVSQNFLYGKQTALEIIKHEHIPDMPRELRVLWKTKPHLFLMTHLKGGEGFMIILTSLGCWNNHIWEGKRIGSYKLSWSPLCTRKCWDCISIFMKDNCADKVCGKLIASLDWGAASCNKQPQSCHSLQSTDYKTWTSFHRSGCGISFLAGCFCNINFTEGGKN